MGKKLSLLISILIVLFLGMLFTVNAAKKKSHPKIGEDMITEDPQVCVACHETQAREWEKGLHGINQVRCFICHGDLEKRFERISKPSECVMCHADKVEDIKRSKKYKTCFECHNGHTLDVKAGAKNIHQK
ncbi:MAG: hypothetical protein ABWJ99_02045 [Caldimicrobium sp.]